MKSDKLRIAVLSIHSSPIGELGTRNTGGMSVYTREVARELGTSGHRVDIYTGATHPSGDRSVNLYENVRLVYLNGGTRKPNDKLALYPRLGEFFGNLECYREEKGLKYDLIHSHYWLSGEVGRLAQRKWDVPHVIRFHTLGAVKNQTGVGEREPRIRIETEYRLVNACQRVLAATDLEKDQLMKFYGADSDKIGIVSCGVNLDLFHPIDKVDARRALGFDLDASIVLYVGRFDPVKGIDRLLKAVSYLTNHKRLLLIVVGGDEGDTPESLELKKLAEKLGISDSVVFAGRVRQEELPPYYSAADVLGVPSYYESFGLVGLESLACGTPVVATPVGAMQKILREGETGRIVEGADPVGMADAIEAFISAQDGPGMSQDAIRTSVLDYNWENVTASIIDEHATVFDRYNGHG